MDLKEALTIMHLADDAVEADVEDAKLKMLQTAKVAEAATYLKNHLRERRGASDATAEQNRAVREPARKEQLEPVVPEEDYMVLRKRAEHLQRQADRMDMQKEIKEAHLLLKAWVMMAQNLSYGWRDAWTCKRQLRRGIKESQKLLDRVKGEGYPEADVLEAGIMEARMLMKRRSW